MAWRNLYDYAVFRYGEPSYANWACSLIRECCSAFLWQNGSIAFSDLAEICRMYSAEIEYSDQNVDRIMDRLRQKP